MTDTPAPRPSLNEVLRRLNDSADFPNYFLPRAAMRLGELLLRDDADPADLVALEALNSVAAKSLADQEAARKEVSAALRALIAEGVR